MCTLRASGISFDVDEWAARSGLQPSTIYRKGEPRLPASQPEGKKNAASGVNITVSDAEWSDLPGQVRDAEVFIRENSCEIEKLREAPGVEGLVLDFPIELRADGVKYAAQSDRFPASLVELAGAAGLALELTIYS